jgi:hypothetical protein
MISPSSRLKNKPSKKPERSGQQAKRAASEAFLADFNSEYGGDMFLRNVGWLLTDYTARLEDRTTHIYRCENLRSYTAKTV